MVKIIIIVMFIIIEGLGSWHLNRLGRHQNRLKVFQVCYFEAGHLSPLMTVEG
jgi:cytochrome oxidase assembly protein ShyY1